jgi:chromate transporter
MRRSPEGLPYSMADETTLRPPTGGLNRDRSSLRELALLCLKLGTIAFGGPAAHVAMLEDEVVRRRGWLTRAQFLDLWGAANLIPGPSSTEMVMHVGRVRAGQAGLVVAGTCFILPAMAMVTAIAWVYVTYQRLPQVGAVMYGVKPVVIAVILQALWRLGRAAVKTKLLGLVGLVGMALSFLGVYPLVVLFGSGILLAAAAWLAHPRKPGEGARVAGLAVAARPTVGRIAPVAGVAGSAAAAPFGLWPLFLVFLKIGAVVFGSGYVLLAFLRGDLVARLHWLTEAQLLDAVAVGQVTPGPVFTTATFIGYLLGGPAGGIVATVGIFLPGFLLVAASAPLVPRLRASPIAGAFLDGVNVGALALIGVVSWQLGRAAIIDVTTTLLAAVSLALLFRFRLNSAWLVLGGATVGLLAGGFGSR